METVAAKPQVQEADIDKIKAVFEEQKAYQYKVAKTTAKQRRAKLKRFHEVLLDHRQEIREALYKDYRKHPAEVDLTEIYPVTGEIKHARHHLASWMREKRVGVPLSQLGSRSYIHYEPKGVVLIISPWNFPINLTFGPLVSAIAAGNTVIIKPSENTPHAARVMKKIVQEVFEEREVAVFEGAVQTSTELLKLPFNHIFFTGAPAIGKVVMEAASKHLASVTLELGGKSPTIVDETANVDDAAKKVAWAKYLNNGQICIAPDYVFVHESKKAEFVQKAQDYIREFYTENAENEGSYARIVNQNHFKRVQGYLEDAVSKGGKVTYGGQSNASEDFLTPTILEDAPLDSKVMQEEIFGPIMPVYSFKDLSEPLKVIQEKEKPLVLYLYSKSRKNIKQVMENTRAGGTCINHSAMHFFNNNLPFGGSNNSGIGKGHGFFGFEAFSNARGVYKQVFPFSAIELMTPPYNNFKQKLIDLTIKWF